MRNKTKEAHEKEIAFKREREGRFYDRNEMETTRINGSSTEVTDGEGMLPRMKSMKEFWSKRTRRSKISFALNTIFIVLLAVFTAVFEYTLTPYHQYIPEAYKWNLSYPEKGNTVPSWSVPFVTFLGPFCCFLGHYLLYREYWKDLLRETFALVNAIFITSFITSVSKNVVGRPRPDFLVRCFPDGNEVWKNGLNYGEALCTTTDSHDLDDVWRSFPSGHTSWCFAGLGFLSLWLLGKTKPYDGRKEPWKVCLILIPIFLAALIGVSRIVDYRHFWTDVFAGALLGSSVAIFVYSIFYRSPFTLYAGQFRKCKDVVGIPTEDLEIGTM